MPNNKYKKSNECSYKLIFLQMIGCQHCNVFEKNEWPSIINSNELKEMNVFIMTKPITHGPYSSYSTGDFKPLSPEYMMCFISGKIWGPAFILEVMFNGEKKLILKDKGTDTSIEGVKTWCKSIISSSIL